ncbi:Ribose ABC transport system, permease protein RbsC (TC 3.A.1.2.1) [hydrothermal vent metagenome]|uniref:Ribose ABC transport system, permease protein RbsC (TC 3.A.1.2.1) n=1 Tax=hydrothermal vent metagenome TaxID=652676 RepID=A0A3B1DQN1_9ZZZZ
MSFSPLQKSLKSHEFGLLLAVMMVIGLTTLLDAQHTYIVSWKFAWESLVNITRQTSMLGIFALGAAIVIISGGIDLSCGSVIAFCGTICASIMLLLAPEEMLNSEPVGATVITIAITGTLLTGLLIGSLHAWLITRVGLPPFVATLATLVGLRSLARVICVGVTESALGEGSTQINIHDANFRYIATSVWIPALLFLGLALMTWLMLSRTVLGRHLYALGGNEEAAKLSGIRTDQMKWIAYCMSAVLSSIAGIIYIGNTSVANPQTLGVGYELNAIAAAVVGGCSLKGGIGTIQGTVLGALFLRVVMDGIAKVIKVSADVYEGLIVGVVVVFAVAFSQVEKRSQKQQLFAGGLGKIAVLNLSFFAAIMLALLGPTFLAENNSLAVWHLAALAFVPTALVLLILSSNKSNKIHWGISFVILLIAIGTGIGLERSLPRIRYDRTIAVVTSARGKIEQVEDGTAVSFSDIEMNDKEFRKLATHLKNITDLVELNLHNIPITEKSIDAIATIKTIRRLKLSKTKIAQENKRKLLRKLPDVQLTW